MNLTDDWFGYTTSAFGAVEFAGTGGTFNVTDYTAFEDCDGTEAAGPSDIGLFCYGSPTVNITDGSFLYSADGFDVFAVAEASASPKVYVTQSNFLYQSNDANAGAFANTSVAGAYTSTYESFSQDSVTDATSPYGAVAVTSTGDTLLQSDNLHSNKTTGIFISGPAQDMAVGIYDTDVIDNAATANAGGVYANLSTSDAVQFINSNVVGNSISGTGNGGGLDVAFANTGGSSSQVEIYSTLFYDNSAGGKGGGVYENPADSPPPLLVDNSIFTGDTAGSDPDFDATGIVTYSDIGNATGTTFASGSGYYYINMSPVLSGQDSTLAGSPGCDFNGGIYLGPEWELSSSSLAATKGDASLDSASFPFDTDIVGTQRKAGTATAAVMGPCVELYTAPAKPATSATGIAPTATDAALGTLDYSQLFPTTPGTVKHSLAFTS